MTKVNSEYGWADVPCTGTQWSARRENARYCIDELQEQGKIDTDDLETLVASIVNTCAAKPIRFFPDLITREMAPSLYGPELPGLRIYVPAEGALDAVKSEGEGSVPSYKSLDGGTHCFYADIHPKSPDQLMDPENAASHFSSSLQQVLDEIEECVQVANAKIDEEHSWIEDDVRTLLTRRRDRRRAFLEAVEPLKIPLHSETMIDIPIEQAALTYEDVQTLGPGHKNFKLSDQIADAVIQSIRSFGTALERSPDTADKLLNLHEETIRDILLMVLNANWRGQATGETFNGDGKTDIVLRHEDRNAIIVECKIWGGQGIFNEALTQLFSYNVWSDTRAAILLIIRLAEPALAVKTAQEEIRKHPNLIRVEIEHAEGGSYIMRSPKDPARAIHLELLPIVIPKKPKPAPKTGKPKKITADKSVQDHHD
ncbi:hypothetical protein DM794_01690 [Paenarthrobacter ureafaciens]|uniref:hypothetical protein n=1 Tax=Paenarthrobacter ureafaciens TaxID=37931 RepID=UPI0015B9398D|nr:hypothetical protein [Paenarthrobacter ureafaciens]NWL25786.1 hypothetical protein [Paenarthrobacter ureafaciens]